MLTFKGYTIHHDNEKGFMLESWYASIPQKRKLFTNKAKMTLQIFFRYGYFKLKWGQDIQEKY